VDVLNGRVLVFNARGKFFSQLSRFGLKAGELFRPNGIVIDHSLGKVDYVFVSDSYSGHISVFKSGRFIGYLLDTNHNPIQFEAPIHLSLHDNKLLVVDALKNSISQLDLSYLQPQPSGKRINKSRQPSKRSISSRKNCISCHVSWDDSPLAQSIVRSEDKVLPVASEKMCYSCHHGAVVESRIAILEQHQHPTIYTESYKEKSRSNKTVKNKKDKNQDKTPAMFPLTDNKELLCSSCHSPHNSDENQEVLYTGHKNSWMRISNQGGNLCERCHESKTIGARSNEKQAGSNHPLAIRFSPAPHKDGQAYVKENHLQHGLPDALLENGAMLDQQQQMICQTCHQIHAGKEKDLLTLSNMHSELCVSCHKSKNAKDKEQAHQNGIHPVNIKLEKVLNYKGKKISQVDCSSCHQAHSGNPGSALIPKELAVQPDDLCLACHKKNYSIAPKEAHRKGIHPANFKLEKAILQDGKKIHSVTCSSCHSMHEGRAGTALFPQQGYSKQTKDKQQALCISCHQQQYADGKKQARAKGIHPVNIKLEEKIKYQGKTLHEVTCATCHKVHKGQKNSALLLEGKEQDGSKQQIEKLCIVCHQRHNAENSEEAFKKGVHPVNKQLKEPVKINDKTVKNVTCLSCHSVHQGKKHTASLVQSDQDGQLCENCHQEQQKVLNTDHDLRITAKEQKNHYDQVPEKSGLCGSCHSMHRGHSDKNQFPFLYADNPPCTNSSSRRKSSSSESSISKIFITSILMFFIS